MATVSRTAGAAGSVTVTIRNSAGQLVTPVSAPTVQWYTDSGRTTGALNLSVSGSGSSYTASWTGGQAPATPASRYLKVTIEVSAGVFDTDVDDDISFVDASSSLSSGLCTLEQVKTQLGKTSSTNDAELQALIDAVSDSIEGFCGQVRPVQVIEYHDGWSDTIVLRSSPIVSVTGLIEYVGSTAYTYSEAAHPGAGGTYTYLVDPSLNGIVRRIGTGGPLRWLGGTLKVTYTAGYSPIPEALREACEVIVQHQWRLRNGGAGLPSLVDQEGTEVEGFSGPVPDRALWLMDRRYRRTGGMA